VHLVIHHGTSDATPCGTPKSWRLMCAERTLTHEPERVIATIAVALG